MANGQRGLSFEHDIKPLFRDEDQQAMQFAFDLWEYADVVEYATDILERLEDGSMPCDAAWPPDQIALFRRWVEQGQGR